MDLTDGRSYVIGSSLKPEDPPKIGNNLLDLSSIAKDVFLLEDQIKNGKKISNITIPLCENYSSKLNEELELLIEFLFEKSIKVNFSIRPQRRFNFSDELSGGYTCLFSGGLDSFSGILNSYHNFGKVTGVATIHFDQRQLVKLLNKLQSLALSNYGIKVKKIDAEKNKKYTRISRGLLYILNAMLVKNTNLIISEVGPTMYQPRFTLLDDISLTTHPQVVKSAKKIAQEILATNINIIEPNANLTKAEVAADSPEKDLLKRTCSCRTMRFCNSAKPNRDSCYGCIIRRIAMIVAGVEDVFCENDVLLSCSSGDARYDNILHLLCFSLDFLTDFDSMPRYTTETIRLYRKEDVFRRFALDTFSALWILKKEDKLKDKIFLKFLDQALTTVKSEELENRIAGVRSNEFKPDFQNII